MPDNHYLYFFDNSETRGYLDVFDNNITLWRCK